MFIITKLYSPTKVWTVKEFDVISLKLKGIGNTTVPFLKLTVISKISVVIEEESYPINIFVLDDLKCNGVERALDVKIYNPPEFTKVKRT